MNLIDEKGRLLGLINLIDFLVLLFLLAMIPAIHFGYRVLVQRPNAWEPFSSSVKELQVDCQLIGIRPEVDNLISVGDKEMDEKDRPIGEILWLDASQPYQADRALRQRHARLKLKAEFRGNDIYYKDRVIDDGSEIIFDTGEYKVTAKVKDDITRMLNMRITLKDLNEDQVKLVEVGDKEVDAEGNLVAQILKIGRPEDNSLDLDLSGGNFTIGRDVAKKQIATEMILKCQVINEDGINKVYYKGKRMRYNQPIEFITDKYRAIGFISKTYELVPEKVLKWVSLRVKFSGTISQVADVIRVGDMERDYYGSTTAKVTRILSNKPAETIAVTEGRLVTLILPSKNDLEILLDVLCEVRGDTYYFKNNSVKMGNPITFSTELYSITGTIIGMEIK